MRRVLQWCAMVLVVGGLLALAGFVGLRLAGHELDPQSKAYADAAVNAIVAHWSPDALLSRATDDIAAVPPDQVEATFAPLRQSLAHARNRGCVGQTAITWMPGSGVSTLGGYKCPLDVTGGRSLVTIVVRRTHGAWKVSGFWVNPTPTP